MRDRWSFSEYDGHLRVAVQQPRRGHRRQRRAWCSTSEDGTAGGDRARVVGLGRGESIQSVRWFGDLAVVVTFRQTDPLYTVDLGDPARPRVVGAP